MLKGFRLIFSKAHTNIRVCALLVVGLFFFSLYSYAQETIPRTSTTDTKVKIKKKKDRPEGKRHYMTIFKTNTKKTLYGNKCFEDFTRQLGFTYEIQAKGRNRDMNGFTRFWNNAATKTALVFTAWPWWKLRVNKRYKECLKLSGDFVG